MTRFSLAAAALAALMLAGCGGGGPAVAGSVTRGGALAGYGAVQFNPDQAKGNTGPAVTLKLVEGRFATTGATTDVPPITPGPQVVTVYVAGAPRPGVPDGEVPTEEFTFTADVPEGGTSDLTFDVTSKAAARPVTSSDH